MYCLSLSINILSVLICLNIFFFQETGRSVAYFETIQAAFEYCDDAERPLVLIHSGVYRGQLIVIETNIALIGAAPGKPQKQNSIHTNKYILVCE